MSHQEQSWDQHPGRHQDKLWQEPLSSLDSQPQAESPTNTHQSESTSYPSGKRSEKPFDMRTVCINHQTGELIISTRLGDAPDTSKWAEEDIDLIAHHFDRNIRRVENDLLRRIVEHMQDTRDPEVSIKRNFNENIDQNQ